MDDFNHARGDGRETRGKRRKRGDATRLSWRNNTSGRSENENDVQDDAAGVEKRSVRVVSSDVVCRWWCTG